MTVPPWFKRGFDFGQDFMSKEGKNSVNRGENKNSNIINLVDLIKADQHLFKPLDSSEIDSTKKESEQKKENVDILIEDSDVINNIPQAGFIIDFNSSFKIFSL